MLYSGTSATLHAKRKYMVEPVNKMRTITLQLTRAGLLQSITGTWNDMEATNNGPEDFADLQTELVSLE